MTLTALLRCATIFAGSLVTADAIAAQAQYSHGEPTAVEQQMLELMNRSRLNPTQEGIILDTVNTWYSVAARAQAPAFFTYLRAEFAQNPAVAPLAFHPTLIQTARAHSQDMVTNHYFAHADLAGRDPSARATAAGYTGGIGENLDGAGASSGDDIIHAHFDLMVDYNNIDTAHPLGHRQNVLNSSYTEVGVGVIGALSGGMITQDFGAPARSYILGVAYVDANGNGRYDEGEGLAGVTVTPDSGNWYAVTSASGGFAIPVDPVETVSDTYNIPIPVQTSPWSAVQPYDASYRQSYLAAAPTTTVNLTWSGGGLAAPISTSVTMKRPVMRNFNIVGSDGWLYRMSMVTTQNVKADLTPAPGALTPPTPSAPLRDFNGDGKADLVFQNDYGQIVAWYLNGSGTVSGGAYLYSGPLYDWKLVGTADMNRDGHADLIMQNNYGQIVVWYLNASGAVTGGAYIYSGGLGEWKVKAVADLNGDGNPDLILQYSTGQIFVWYTNGSGAVSGSTYLYSGVLGDWKVAAVVDINGDGNADLVLQYSTGQIVVWYLNGSGSVSGSTYLYSGVLGDWKVKGAADINGDGNADLLLQNNIGQVAVWYMNGRSTNTGSAYLYTGGMGDWRVR